MARKARRFFSITAAASRVIDPTDTRSKSKSPDAESLYGLYTELGPIHAAMQSKFLAASKITYFPAEKLDPDSDPEPITDGPALEAYERLKGPHGEFADFVAEMAMHWEIPGEGYLVGRGLGEDEEWDIWSPVEYDQKRRDLGLPEEDAAPNLEAGNVAIRCWRAHPMRRELPDSPLRSVARQCEQLMLFQDMLTALGRSRLLGKLTVWPSEMELPDVDDNGTKQTVFDLIYAAMNEAVTDTRSAGRLVGPAIEGPADLLDKIRAIDLTQDLPEWVPVMIEKVTREIAIGLDLPADILTGMADVNHWSAWLIDDSLRLNYVDPLILAVLDSFTRGYLHPYLEVAGVEDVHRFLFWRDYSDLTSRTVTPVDALASLEAGIISKEAARRVIGFTEADAPDEDEEPEPVAEPLIEMRDIPDTLPQVVAASAAPRLSLAQIDHRVYTQISEASQAALDRVMERAGSRIRSQVLGAARDHRPAGRNQTFAQVIDGVDNFNVAMVLGREAVAALQLSDDDLVPLGSWTRLGQRLDKILHQGQDDTYRTVSELTNAEPSRDEAVEKTWRENAVAAFLGALSGFALSRLFTPPMTPDPAETGEVPSTEIPAPLVFDAMTHASGGTPGQEIRGLANGQMTVDWVAEVGATIRERRWTVGAPTMPFEPHHRLSGVTFEAWTDDRLQTPLSASWIGYDFMFPGDHRGCQCVAELVISEGETLVPVAA